MKNSFFNLPGIPVCENGFSVKRKSIFKEFFIQASGNGFLSSGNSVPLFRDLLKILEFRGGNFFKRNLTVFFVKTDFRASGSQFYFNF